MPTLRYLTLAPDLPVLPHYRLCAGWLLDLLSVAGRPLRPCEVVEAARRAGFPRPTLYRARRALEGQVVDVGNSPHDPAKQWAIGISENAPSRP